MDDDGRSVPRPRNVGVVRRIDIDLLGRGTSIERGIRR